MICNGMSCTEVSIILSMSSLLNVKYLTKMSSVAILGVAEVIIDSNIPIRNLKMTRGHIHSHSTSTECKFSDSFDDNSNTFYGGDFNVFDFQW